MSGLTVDHLKQQFDAFSSNGASGDPEWVREARADAITTFAQLDFPSTRQEEWRFTNVKPVLQHAFEVAGPARADADLVAEYQYPGDAVRLVLVNGHLDESRSDLSALPEGVTVTDLPSALREHGSLLKDHFAGQLPNGFVALNRAFARNGVFIHVPAGVHVAPEIRVLYLTVGGPEPLMTNVSTLAVIEDTASATVVETYGGRSDAAYLTNASTEARIGDGARLDWYRVQREAKDAFHVASTKSVQGRDSHYGFVAVPLGGALARHDVRMVMDGEGGEGTLNGLYVIGDRQHVDHQTVIEHAKPHCQSFEYFNGILDDRARAVFNGRIIVHTGAQKTDSKQTNNNLLLSESARADSQPQLEIYADDVRCTHGATLGPLDDNSLFYLQSRGLDAEAARRLMTYGFAREILDGIRSEAVKEKLEQLVLERLGASDE